MFVYALCPDACERLRQAPPQRFSEPEAAPEIYIQNKGLIADLKAQLRRTDFGLMSCPNRAKTNFFHEVLHGLTEVVDFRYNSYVD